MASFGTTISKFQLNLNEIFNHNVSGKFKSRLTSPDVCLLVKANFVKQFVLCFGNFGHKAFEFKLNSDHQNPNNFAERKKWAKN